MDALRSAGRAIIRSPSMAKQSWSAGRHRKLPENWSDTQETIIEGMTFHLRHLGMTLVDQPKGEELSSAAVKRIVATSKVSGKKPQEVALKISPQGIMLYDRPNNKLLDNVSIHSLNGTLECHAYLCSKRKVAQAVALTVAQAFTVAFELWQVAKEASLSLEKGKCSHSERSNSLGGLQAADATTDNLLELEGSVSVGVESSSHLDKDQVDNQRPAGTSTNPEWELKDNLDEAFSRLAVSRTNPQVLDTGLMPHDCLPAPNWHSTKGDSGPFLSPFGKDFLTL
ncbi:low density lipoprotein receptor adapter protein 1-A-like isoform X2 [Cynoglossus semilaevis]|uniref:low density lipoprotein receptor adapter protein 1-A-like isoform X2 n=1 Tax=Cynoglossus semilaevis TaxID=244447 RepID=UPI000D62EB93|nr:low density lipoprotein receptor adapter protein 1-A-like isoform X2 [Cynoglossus semilaevis]